MTFVDQIEITSSDSSAAMDQPALANYVDWGAILAGAVVTAAIFTLMTTFGAALGLSLTSPFSGQGVSAVALTVASALWVLWIGVSSFIAGAYLAGRLRRRINDASEHESDVRDGAHGLVVWAIGTILIAILATASAAGVARTAASATALVTGSDPLGYAADRLMRTTSQTAALPDYNRQDVRHILATSALAGSVAADDKAYLTAQITARSGVSADEAAKRIDTTMSMIAADTEKAKQAAEAARKIGILVAFLTAASLAVSAAAAWWAAGKGGNHRDEATDLSHLTAWR